AVASQGQVVVERTVQDRAYGPSSTSDAAPGSEGFFFRTCGGVGAAYCLVVRERAAADEHGPARLIENATADSSICAPAPAPPVRVTPPARTLLWGARPPGAPSPPIAWLPVKMLFTTVRLPVFAMPPPTPSPGKDWPGVLPSPAMARLPMKVQSVTVALDPIL